jgi:ABC-2 type transport system permease protein
LANVFTSAELASLIEPSAVADPAAARALVDADKVAAAIIIPAGFTRSIIPAPGEMPVGKVVAVELYTNPTRPTGVGVIKTILEGFMSQVEVGRVGGQVAVTQLIEQGLIRPQDAADHGGAIGASLGARQANAAETAAAIALHTNASSGEAAGFDPLAYMAPGMALMFLMFTATNGGRTLLTERAQGTLPRLLISPTTSAQVLGGKTTGIYLTGVAQMLILIVASALLFQLRWGAPFAVLVLILAAVAGAVGWGMLITALAKTPGQVSTIGSAVTLIFGILGGSFTNTGNLPEWFQTLGKITPNAWGLEGFTILALGGGLADILVPVAALLIMGATLFTAAVLLLNRRGLAEP